MIHSLAELDTFLELLVAGEWTAGQVGHIKAVLRGALQLSKCRHCLGRAPDFRATADKLVELAGLKGEVADEYKARTFEVLMLIYMTSDQHMPWQVSDSAIDKLFANRSVGAEYFAAWRRTQRKGQLRRARERAALRVGADSGPALH